MGPQRTGRCLKRFLEVVCFIVTDYGPVGSHGDPIHNQIAVLRPNVFAALRAQTCVVFADSPCG